MQLNTIIFDMDGLLIDSEPLWGEAATEVFSDYGFKLTPAQYAITTGMRTKEFVEWWFKHFKINEQHHAAAVQNILTTVVDKVIAKGKPMAGVEHIFNFFIERNFK